MNFQKDFLIKFKKLFFKFIYSLVAAIKRFAFKIEYKHLLSTSFSNTEHFNCTNLPITLDIVDLVIIAFNNAEVIEYQIKLLKRFFKDKYFLTIADNSSNRQKRAEIKEICNSLEVGYIAIPRNIIWKFSASRSHGAALNFIF